MKKYYLHFYSELIPCYLIKEGYIPCSDYRKNKNDPWYNYFNRESFCLASSTAKEVFENLAEGKKYVEDHIKNKKRCEILDVIERMQYRLKRLEEVK